ncbi:low-density lipoprotein receptor 2-like [Mercenaria mercenaria]|uniref:low-density lipoprotein receptor 2-like n=1 Tax=Mercenaria mercenaria TaxID=6596 RepID=UPI00234F1314|nr:low-density lipoprotein receptor 2-like [Mercenaria mercenaria]
MFEVFSLLCYSCKDVLSNEACFNISKCPSAELCYGRADGFLTGDVKHTTGCTKEMNPVKANGSGATTFCSHACHENLCNFEECVKGSGNLIRGPRCLSCDYVESPDDCTNVTECSKDEVLDTINDKTTVF